VTFVWTDDITAAAVKLYRDGLTASQIAAEIGCPSRSAVIGKMHRMNMTGTRQSPGGGNA
jgi:GcrA cell cycle regulator